MLQRNTVPCLVCHPHQRCMSPPLALRGTRPTPHPLGSGVAGGANGLPQVDQGVLITVSIHALHLHIPTSTAKDTGLVGAKTRCGMRGVLTGSTAWGRCKTFPHSDVNTGATRQFDRVQQAAAEYSSCAYS
jgi:hypothetical protein